MPYRQPSQERALLTQEKLLAALDELLKEQSFEETTVEQIALRASSTKSAFLKRFGSKEESLFVLFAIYASEASAMMTEFSENLDDGLPLRTVFFDMSFRFDMLLQKHSSANRAMNEYFKRELESHDLTKKILSECVKMMMLIQRRYLRHGYSEAGAFASAQLLVSIDFHYAMRAMPALPADPVQRHSLLAEILELTIKK